MEPLLKDTSEIRTLLLSSDDILFFLASGVHNREVPLYMNLQLHAHVS